jgi:hypothetical protein
MLYLTGLLFVKKVLVITLKLQQCGLHLLRTVREILKLLEE